MISVYTSPSWKFEQRFASFRNIPNPPVLTYEDFEKTIKSGREEINSTQQKTRGLMIYFILFICYYLSNSIYFYHHYFFLLFSFFLSYFAIFGCSLLFYYYYFILYYFIHHIKLSFYDHFLFFSF